MNDTLGLIREVLAEHHKLPAEKVVPEATLQSLGLDSLALFELIFECEGRLGITVPDSAANPATVAELIALIETLRAQSVPPK
jgi:acyl carrier protein